MIIPKTPENEVERLQNLASYCILDSERSDDFDGMTTLASEFFDAPISVITIIDKERQWFKSKVGIDGNETHRNISFCGHAIITPEKLLIVEDAREDVRFSGNPQVTGDPHIVFYAGAPIVSAEGYPFGTICIVDFKPRKLTERQEKFLKILGQQVSNLLNLRKKNLQLNDALKEKSMLIKEVHHRVKNNLQIISSLLNLQIRSDIGKEATYALESSRDRIMAMSIIHQQLYQNNSIQNVDFQKYLEQLIDSTQRVYSTVGIVVNCCVIQLKTDIAVPLSLIVSEVITNACKHGFKSQFNSLIEIEVNLLSERKISLKIRDNGIGFSKVEKWERSASLGFEIIKTLTSQINGRVECESSSNGTTFNFEIPFDQDFSEIKQTA